MQLASRRHVEHSPPVVRGERPLSIVVVSYQCRDLLVRCLASLEEDALAHGYQTIVVDNASTDDSAAVVRSRFPWVEWIDMEANAGFSAATNVGIRAAAGRQVLLLNPDTVVPSGALAAAGEALDADDDVGMLGVKLVQEDGTLDHACKRGFPTPLSALAYFTGLSRIGWKRLGRYTAAQLDPDQVDVVDAVNGAFMLVKCEAIENVGLLDEAYWLYMEDLDWCYRFWQAGWKILYWPRATVVHVKGGSSGRARSWQANRAFHRGMWLFYRKHYAGKRSPLVTAAVFVAIQMKLGVSALSSPFRRWSTRWLAQGS